MREDKEKEIIKRGEKSISKEIRKIKKRIPAGEKRKIVPALRNLSAHMNSLYDMATKDDKTGLYNMRFFDTILEHEIKRVERYKKDLSIVIIDADNFKQINDNYGHRQGDTVLLRIAKVIKENTRKSDVLARFGGEEFVILLPNTEVRKALRISERLRKKIMIDKELFRIGVTISIGISNFEPNDNIATLFEKADKALLTAKREGKNRTVLLSGRDALDIHRLAS